MGSLGDETAPTLATLLRDLRVEVRLSQRKLAKSAGVGESTIKRLEGGGAGVEPGTIELIANGLARDGKGRLDGDQAAIYRDRLMQAAGYGPRAQPPVTEATPDPLLEHIRRTFGQDSRAVEDWLEETEGYTLADKKFTLAAIEWLQDIMGRGREHRDQHRPGRSFAR